MFAFFILLRKKDFAMYNVINLRDYAISTYGAVLYQCFPVITPCFTLPVT